jgi:hypothetical protein
MKGTIPVAVFKIIMSTITLNRDHFNLDVGGFAGFFGGDEAVSAMETVHLYRARRWTG